MGVGVWVSRGEGRDVVLRTSIPGEVSVHEVKSPTAPPV
jgi:hypothetical protein